MNRYPTRDNVYNLQRERQRRQAQAERQAREWQQAQMGYAQTPHPAKEEEAQAEKKGRPHDDGAFVWHSQSLRCIWWGRLAALR